MKGNERTGTSFAGKFGQKSEVPNTGGAVGQVMKLSVLAFSSAEQFLESGRFDEPGCLILDIKLPRLSGLELLTKLRESSCDLPVIVISGHADVPQAVLAMQRGALTVLEKPFALNELMTQVRQAFERDYGTVVSILS
jgi:FixJ family two-component response regulator